MKAPEQNIEETVMQAPEAAQIGQEVMSLANQEPVRTAPEAVATAPAEQSPVMPEASAQSVAAPAVGFHDAAPVVSTPETTAPAAAPAMPEAAVAPAAMSETVVAPSAEQSPVMPEASAEQPAQMPAAETNVAPQAGLNGSAA